MTVLATTAVLAVLVVVLGVAVRAPDRPALAILALLFPVALVAPESVTEHLKHTRANAQLGESEAALFAAPQIARARNVELALAAERLIPPESVYGVVFVPASRRSSARRVGLPELGWIQFWLAPRIAVRGADATWVLVYRGSPEQAGIPYRRAWRFGDDWVIQR